MPSSVNEISQIKKIVVKPMCWRVLEQIDGKFSLLFSYVEPARGEFYEVVTRRGGKKRYTTVQAVISDIRKVMLTPVVYFDFKSQPG